MLKIRYNYKYIINNQETSYNSSFNYRVNNSNIKTVKVKVKDIVGNVKEIDCNIKYMDPTIGNNNIKYYFNIYMHVIYNCIKINYSY